MVNPSATVPSALNIQTQVTDLLKREVILMREILANMHEEEIALIEKDPKALQAVMVERDGPLQDLQEVREERSSKICELLSLLDTHKNGISKENINLSTLLEAKGLESCEVMVLRDQLISLIEKMNEQNTANEHLMQQTVSFWNEMMQGKLMDEYHTLIPIHGLVERRKTSMLTVINPDAKNI